jgi:purine-binding chemotaxis protein CheW
LAAQDSRNVPLLIVRAADRLCGVPLTSVVEILRPVAIQELAGLPAYLCGLSVIRGQPTAVVDVSTLLTGISDGRIGRFLSMRTDGKPFALRVQSVLGIDRVERHTLRGLPELAEPARDLVDSVGTLGKELLTVLRSSLAFSQEVWAGIDRARGLASS